MDRGYWSVASLRNRNDGFYLLASGEPQAVVPEVQKLPSMSWPQAIAIISTQVFIVIIVVVAILYL